MAVNLINSSDIEITQTGDNIQLSTTIDMQSVEEQSQINKEDITNIKNGNVYSLDETNTGKIWIDGKPIYRRVIVVDNITTYGDYVSTGISLTNVDNVVELKSTAKRIPSANNYAWYMTGTLTENAASNNYITAVRFTNGVVQYLANASSYGIKKIIIIIEYTKN